MVNALEITGLVNRKDSMREKFNEPGTAHCRAQNLSHTDPITYHTWSLYKEKNNFVKREAAKR